MDNINQEPLVDTNEGTSDTSEATIARRTRSHLRLDDSFVLGDNLDFPDVDRNLYQNPDSVGDTEYKNFLYECYGGVDLGTEANTDDNDPAYVYNDDIFSHGWKFNLDEELGQEAGDQLHFAKLEPPPAICDQTQQAQEIPSDIHDATIATATTSAAAETKSPSKRQTRIDMFDDPEFSRILNQQLRQHIQLLTQTYLLTKNCPNMRSEAEDTEGYLNSYVKVFKDRKKPSNLMPAMEIIKTFPQGQKSSIRLNWRLPDVPKQIQQIIDQKPDVFLYKSLLPQHGFSTLRCPKVSTKVPKKSKIYFTPNEDKLLAYALNEFKNEQSQYAFVASLLMPSKTKTQIINHIKNIKRSQENANNPIKLFFSHGKLPEIDLDSDSTIVSHHNSVKPIDDNNDEVDNEESDKDNIDNEKVDSDNIDNDDMFNMDLDDLMAASMTISKQAQIPSNNTTENNRNIKNMKLKKSMISLMSRKFQLSQDMGEAIIVDFLRESEKNLSERDHLHLLQLLSDLLRGEAKKDSTEVAVLVYKKISKYLYKINAPMELHQKLILFLDLDQATKCGCASNYLHWMRFFEFMHHVKLCHDSEAFEKKLNRLIDALQKKDDHKIKLATANLVNKHPLLQRELDSLALDGKPHPSEFFCEEEFDDITEALSSFKNTNSACLREAASIYDYEHFNSKLSKDEINYATQACPCKCHSGQISDCQPDQHCSKCNLKFIKGRLYLVHKIKPNLAEWSYVTPSSAVSSPSGALMPQPLDWTFEEDKEILEFCRTKAEQNDETVSFDTSTFEELVGNRRPSSESITSCSGRKRSAREVAERFNQLMQIYKDENSNTVL